MSNFNLNAPFTRRRALALGASVAGGFLATATLGRNAAWAQSDDTVAPMWTGVTHEIEQILQAQGMLSNGVFTVEIDRDDITDVSVHGVHIYPSFELNGDIVFQPANKSSSLVAMNADMALKASELDHFIRELTTHTISFQAEHQHLYDFQPVIWFVHFRAIGNPVTIARGVKAALNVTSTPFPQKLPSNPTTPLPYRDIGDILGSKPNIGSDGVVTYDVPRRETLQLAGMVINPYLNVQTTVAFQPIHGSGSNAACVPDFGMIATEVQPVTSVMQSQGWDVGCLYNQETEEHPQLYFSHQFKTGDPITLAHEVRKGLNRMNVKFS